MDTADQERPIAGHRALAEFLTEHGVGIEIERAPL
jgi:hypothetical protein